MSNQIEADPRLIRRLNIFSAATALFAIASGTVVLLGWGLGSARLKSWLPGQPSVRVNAAVCLALLGLALWGLRKESLRDAWKIGRVASQFAAGCVTLAGLVSLAENLFGWDLHIDQLLHAVRAGEEVGATRAGLIPLVASVGLALLGMALLTVDWKTRNCDWLSQFLAGTAGVVSSLGLLDFALKVGSSQTHIAFPGAVNLTLLSLGIICARPQAAFGGLLVSQSAGAKWLRRTGPVALAVLVVFGKLTSRALLTESHFAWIEVCAIAITAGLLLGAHILSAALLADRSERAEQALRLRPEQLAGSVGPQEESSVEANVRRWSVIGITLGMVLAALGGLSTWRSVKKAAEDAAWVTHTYAVKQALEQSLSHVIDIETGARGYAATGDEVFLQPFRWGKNSIHDDLDRVQALTSDDPMQQERLRGLRTEIDSRIENAGNTVAARQQNNAVPSPALFWEGKRRMDRLRATIREMQAEEDALLNQRAKAAENGRQQAAVVILITTVLGVILLLFAAHATSREVRRSVKLRSDINNLNLDLERRVRDRTEDLRLSEKRVRVLLDSTAEAIFGQDAEGNCVFCNRAAEYLFGYPVPELLGKNIHHLIHHSRQDGRALDAEECPIAKAAQRGEKCHNDQLVFWRKDGTSFAAETWSHPLLVDGKVFGAVVTCLDISQRRAAEESLRRSEERFRALVAASSDIVYRMSADWSEMYHLDGRDFVADTDAPNGDWIQKYIHPDDQPQVMAAIQKAILTKSTFELEHRVRRVDGSLGWTFSRAIPLLHENGEIAEWFGAASDVTQRKQAEQALRESEAQFRTLANAIPQLCWMANPDGWIFWYNDRWYQYTGTTPEDMQGWGWQSVHQREVLPKVLSRWRASIAEAKPFEMVFPLRGADGVFRSFLTLVVPVCDMEGKVIRWFGTNTDVSEQEQVTAALRNSEERLRLFNNELETRVRQRTEQLEAANKEMEAFTYSVSHDLRAPLRHISGFSKILMDECAKDISEEAKHYLLRIHEGTRRMGLLVDDLLNLARVGRRDLNPQVTGLRSVVEEVISSLALDFAGREVEWKLSDLPFVDCDAALIQQVFQNLISNAIKFTRPRSKAIIEIGQTQQDGSPVIFVRDNGAGFSMKYADKLFRVFQRLHRSEDFEGTGIGLATVQRIVQKHGGRVWAEAELDKGATFYFTLNKSDIHKPSVEVVAAGEQA